jgi:uncharacterized protein YjaZ
MKIHFADSDYWDGVGSEFKAEYKSIVTKAYKEGSKLLPFGSKRVNFFVEPSPYSYIEETGGSGWTLNSEFIRLTFDPGFKVGKNAVLKNTYSTVLHEMNHAARYNKNIWHKSAIDMCIIEGLATVFERDHTDSKPLWGEYDSKVIEDWVKEVSGLKDGMLSEEYRFKHKDGRKWIGYKVGSYIIDEAVKNSGKSVIDLTQMECSEILKLAKLKR